MINPYFIELFFLVLLVITILYSFGLSYLKKGLRKKYDIITAQYPSISIIVCMHNEERNAAKCLDKLVVQDYPPDRFEIVVVNDRSTDGTGRILKQYAEEYSFIHHIDILKIDKNFAPKKYAIDQAINFAKGEIILLTDADGRPTNQWAKEVSSLFSEPIGMVIGYAPYNAEVPQTKLWDRLLSLEYFSQASVAAASCGVGYPLTCVGTNMAYRKVVYNQLGGFGIYKKLHTGDDDLFLQRVREETDWQIAYASAPQSHVYNEPPTTWQKFYQQRIRYASKGFKYPFRITLILILFYFLNLLLLGSPLLLLNCTNCILPFLAILFLKLSSEFSFLKLASSYLEDKRFLNLFPVAFILHIPYVVFFGLFAQILIFKWGDHSST
jgi:cellulose synthase/poly-beta-1,6-N-acetylglucosamine synthase-like glycosyltransferase